MTPPAVPPAEPLTGIGPLPATEPTTAVAPAEPVITVGPPPVPDPETTAVSPTRPAVPIPTAGPMEAAEPLTGSVGTESASAWTGTPPVDPVTTAEAVAAGGPVRTAVLSGEGGCIAEARHLAAGFLAEVAAGGRAVSERSLHLIQLVVSELVTNACKYAPGPVLLKLRLTGDTVEVEVWDGDPVLPTARPADPGRIGQHGLEIVKAIALALGAERAEGGKRVTATIALEPDSSSGGMHASGRGRRGSVGRGADDDRADRPGGAHDGDDDRAGY
ncbi:ATP-binding protein [Streptomyces sp. NPDC090073]|uniref:ATP-binding protein n=1 Tax=Streptomyces sp. NPDC090073 TaxID=3365936 RepID=UPI003800933A